MTRSTRWKAILRVSRILLRQSFSPSNILILDISVATLTWMLQCIAPHLDIDQDAFQKLNMQYRIWLTRIRYACTYHHEATEGWGEYLWKKIPDVPFVGEEPDPLKPPRRDPLQ